MKSRTYIKEGKIITVKHRVSSVHKGQTAPKDHKWLEFIHMQGFFKIGETAMPIHSSLNQEQIGKLVDMYIQELIKQENDSKTDKTNS